MEFLVTMTTHVPDGTPDEAVDDIRAREANRARELARQGRLLRLWRPPLKPGEWRTLGLFAADDADQLEETLASMPLRVWRTDEVAPLSPHPNDPILRAGATPTTSPGQEFLVEFAIAVPGGAVASEITQREVAESAAADRLAAEGHLLRLWKPAQPHSGSSAFGLYRAATEAALSQLLDALPLRDWMTVVVTPFSPHLSDPGLPGQDQKAASRSAGNDEQVS